MGILWKWERSKPRKSRKSRKFFLQIFLKSDFSILASRHSRKPGNEKTRNNISEISEKFPKFLNFRFATFSFFGIKKFWDFWVFDYGYESRSKTRKFPELYPLLQVLTVVATEDFKATTATTTKWTEAKTLWR